MNTHTQTLTTTTATNLDQWVMRIAGGFILVSLLLAYLVSPYFLWFTAFVGANLFQTSFTGFCPLAIILRKLGVQPGQTFCKQKSV